MAKRTPHIPQDPSVIIEDGDFVIPGCRIRTSKTASLISKTDIPSFDYAINPYIGCSNGCVYCYAAFMDAFNNHAEKWGSYIDVRISEEPLSASKLTGKKIFISSVCDPYGAQEEKFALMRDILDQLSHIECSIQISTKSTLVLRDLDLLKAQNDVCVDLSLNTLDDYFRSLCDNAASVKERLNTLRTLHASSIKTALYISPIFPELTDPETIIEETRDFVDFYMFEDLQLRYPYKDNVLKLVSGKYPHLRELYYDIYVKDDRSYFDFLEQDIIGYCEENGIEYMNAFHHGKKVSDIKYDSDPFGGDSLFK